MARNQQLKQLIRIFKIMKFSDRCKLLDLDVTAKKMKVHKNTIRRDLKALKAVGINIKIKRKRDET